ncbi:unnamed protein product, partial [Urochloa humidicola]
RASFSTRRASAGCCFATAGQPPPPTRSDSSISTTAAARPPRTLHRYIRVITDLAGGHTLTRADDSRFQQLYDSLLAQPNCHAHRRVLLSFRSDRTRASRSYHNTKPKAVDDIIHLVADCPELKPKLSRLPHCTFHPTTSIAPLRYTSLSVVIFLLCYQFTTADRCLLLAAGYGDARRVTKINMA